jgi:chromosome partitioning protein
MGKIISIFNHKGGVGKTTLTYNLAWMLAEMGHKVLMIDADAQQNLSLLVRGKIEEERDLADNELFDKPYFWDHYLNIYDIFKHFLYPGNEKSDKPVFSKENKNFKTQNLSGKLDLLLGSLDVEMINRDLPLMLAQAGGGRKIAYQLQKAVDDVASNYDYVIIDLSPSISQFNLLLVTVSHYWIAPVFHNHFCYKAMGSMKEVFTNFHETIANYKTNERDRVGLDIRYKFLGYVTQNFRRNTKSKNKDIVNAFESWRAKINEESIKLATHLYDLKRSFSLSEFKNYFPEENPYNLAEISDFNRLGAMSQKYGVPAYRITRDILISDEDNDQLHTKAEKPSDDWTRMESWEKSYRKLAERILNLP